MVKKLIFALILVLALSLCACGDADIVIHTANSDRPIETTAQTEPENGIAVVINKNSMTFHFPDCTYASKMAEKNRLDLTVETVAELLDHGYTPCGICAADYKKQNSEETSK